MDKIDVERLKTDLAYWNKHAPEGATHYNANDGDPDCLWMRSGWQAWLRDEGGWVDDDSSANYMAAYIPRPSPAWGGSGLPPVGVECEVCTAQRWVAAKILYIDGRHCIAIGADQSGASTHYKTQKTQFRPLKTEKERVVVAAMDGLGIGKDAQAVRRTVEFLYDSGYLKEPAND